MLIRPGTCIKITADTKEPGFPPALRCNANKVSKEISMGTRDYADAILEKVEEVLNKFVECEITGISEYDLIAKFK